MSAPLSSKPIPDSVSKAIAFPNAPWRIQPRLLKPLQAQSGALKVNEVRLTSTCLEAEFIKTYFLAHKPEGLGIRSICCLYQPGTTEAFEKEVQNSARKTKTFVPWDKKTQWEEINEQDQVVFESIDYRRNEVRERFDDMCRPFSAINLDGENPLVVHILPLWEILRAGLNERFAQGTHLTNSAQFASLPADNEQVDKLYLSWAVIEEPMPVLSGPDRANLIEKGADREFDAYHIPLGYSVRTDSSTYRPYYLLGNTKLDHFVLLNKAKKLARFCVDLAPDTPSRFPTTFVPDISHCFMACERGDEKTVMSWVKKRQALLNETTIDGESLLYACLDDSKLSLLQFLCSSNSNLKNKVRNDGFSLRFIATWFGQKETLAWLNQQFDSAYTAKEFVKEATQNNYRAEEITQALERIGWYHPEYVQTEKKTEITNISPSKNEFVGREGLLTDLEVALTTSKFARVHLGGEEDSGVESLLEEFIRRHSGNYSIIWDFTINGVSSGLRELGKKLKLSLSTDKCDQVLHILQTWLKQNPSALFIAHSNDLKFLPEGLGHVVTLSEEPSLEKKLPVVPLSESEALSLLHQISKKEEPHHDGADIAKALKNHPFSLKLAGHLIREASLSFKDFLSLLRQEMREVFSHPDAVVTQKEIVTILLRLSLKKSGEVFKDSRRLAVQIAHLSSHEIPIELLSGVSVAQSIENLERMGVVKFDRERGLVSMHRFIQRTIRDDHLDQQRVALDNLVRKFEELLQNFHEDKAQTWEIGEKLYPHLKSICTYMALYPELNKNTAIFLNQLGILSSRMEFDQSGTIDLFEQALRLLTSDEKSAQFGLTDPLVASVLQNKGRAYLTRGMANDAIADLNVSFSAFASQSKSIEQAMTMQHLAEAYKLKRQITRALPTQNEALTLLIEKLGDHDLEVGKAWNTLALLYQANGDLLLAIEYFKKAAGIWRNSRDERQVFALILEDLAFAYKQQAKSCPKEVERTQYLDNAAIYFSESLEIWKELYREDHPQINTNLNNLGDVYFKQKKYAQAKELYSEALEKNKKIYGENHLDVAMGYYNLGVIAFSEGDLTEAENLHRASLKIRRADYRQGHENIVDSLMALAKIHQSEGNFEAVRDFAADAIEINRQNKKHKSLDFAHTLDLLGGAFLELSQLEKGHECFNESLNIKQKIDKSLVPSATGRLGHIYLRQGKFEQARESYNIALTAAKTNSANNELLEVAYWSGLMGMAYLEEGQLELAKTHFEEANMTSAEFNEGKNEQNGRALRGLGEISIAKKNPTGITDLLTSLDIMRFVKDRGDVEIGLCLLKLGSAYRQGQEFNSARGYLDEAHNLFKKRYGEEHPYTGKVMIEYALLMQAQNEKTEAQAWASRAVKAFKKLGNEHPEAARATQILQELKKPTPTPLQPIDPNISQTQGQSARSRAPRTQKDPNEGCIVS